MPTDIRATPSTNVSGSKKLTHKEKMKLRKQKRQQDCEKPARNQVLHTVPREQLNDYYHCSHNQRGASIIQTHERFRSVRTEKRTSEVGTA
jgi:hypothetical protein